jgi:hypothetical protein
MDPPSMPATLEENISIQDLHPVHQMRIKEAFEGLSDKEKHYAHWMARWD